MREFRTMALPQRQYFPILVLISTSLGVAFQNYFLFLAPVFFLFAVTSVYRLHWIFYLLLFSIPFSTELELPGGFSTDFPDEPIMWWLFCLGVIYIIITRTEDIKNWMKHPLTWAILVHWVWIFYTSITSQDMIASIKFWLAKTWYLMVFYLMAYVFLKTYKRMLVFSVISVLAAVITVLIVEYKHAASGFAFDQINTAVRPFYRNHVTYASLLVCLLPYTLPVWHYLKGDGIKRLLWTMAILILLCGIFLSYTRAAYLAVLGIVLVYPLLKWRLVHTAAVAVPVILLVVFFYFISGNRYLELAPDYNKAIAHHEFSTLLEATPQGKDISTMERVYRWVAGVNMVGDRYLVGFGPAGFYNAYKPYTLNQFTTYVSDNPERSTIHNYYLMTAVEQGIPGLLFFLILVYLVYLEAQRMFKSRDPVLRRWGIAAIWSFTSILILLFFNDMIETDKVGSYFFINIAILVRLNHMRNPE